MTYELVDAGVIDGGIGLGELPNRPFDTATIVFVAILRRSEDTANGAELFAIWMGKALWPMASECCLPGGRGESSRHIPCWKCSR